MSTSRLRTKTEGPETIVASIALNGEPVGVGSQTYYSANWEMSDEIDDNFHARRSRGEIFNNDCLLTVSKRYWSQKQGSTSSFNNIDPTNVYTYMVDGNLTQYMLDLSNAYQLDIVIPQSVGADPGNMAKHYALQHVDSTPYEFAEDLGEIGETIRFLRNPLASLRQVNDVFRGRIRRARTIKDNLQRAEALADLWKQYRFAAAPLVRSVLSAWDAATNWDNIERPARRTAHGFSSASSGEDVSYSEPFQQLSWPTEERIFRFKLTDTTTIEAHAAIHYEVSNPIVDWKFALGLRAKDIPTTAWELVPLSFMVDRLVNIKGMIAGLLNLADPTVTFHASSLRLKTSDKREISCVAWWTSLGLRTLGKIDPDSVFVENFRYDRTRWEPSIGDVVPGFTPQNLIKDISSTLDLLSLVIGKTPHFI